MPKIKLSALVSDIKGKSNGSVFSKNKSGVYFRNNPSGGGKKSVKWDKQKSLLGSLSTQWKSLTPAQQEAWNDAVTNYQTTNAFGDLRIPSGYELFMRLNGSLLSAKKMSQGCDGDEECNYGYMCIGGECQPVSTEKLSGFPALVTPLTPRTIPDTGIVQLEYPDLFQLNPNKKLMLFNPNDFEQNYFLECGNTIEEQFTMQNRNLAFRFELNEKQYSTVNINTVYDLMTFQDKNSFGTIVRLTNISNNAFAIRTVINTSTGLVEFITNVNENLFSKSFHLSLNYVGSGATDIEFYVNGSKVISSFQQTGTFTNDNRDFIYRINSTFVESAAKLFISDVRYFDEALSSDNILLVSLGYVLDTEVGITDCITHSSNVFTNFGTAGTNFEFNLIGWDEIANFLAPATFFLIPKLSFTVENEGLPGLYLNVYATPPLSYGKTGTQTNLKLLASMEWNTQTTFDFAPYYQSVFASIPPNSQVQLYVSYLDSTTGVQPKTKKKGNGKNVRFKAGADLTDKVN